MLESGRGGGGGCKSVPTPDQGWGQLHKPDYDYSALEILNYDYGRPITISDFSTVETIPGFYAASTLV